MIEIKNLHKTLHQPEKITRLLDGFTARFERGQITSIVGDSESGKNALLKYLIGASAPDSGEVCIEGKDIVSMDAEAKNRMRKNIGILFQSGALFHSLSVEENVALPLREHTDLNESTIRIMVKMKLEMVGLKGLELSNPDQLTPGMVKRVALARAIALDPKIIIYDEPFHGLDPIAAGVMEKLIGDLNRKMWITSIVITQDVQSALRISDRMLMLQQGRIIATGSPKDLKTHSDPRVVQFMQGAPDGPIPFAYNTNIFNEPGKALTSF